MNECSGDLFVSNSGGVCSTISNPKGSRILKDWLIIWFWLTILDVLMCFL